MRNVYAWILFQLQSIFKRHAYAASVIHLYVYYGQYPSTGGSTSGHCLALSMGIGMHWLHTVILTVYCKCLGHSEAKSPTDSLARKVQPSLLRIVISKTHFHRFYLHCYWILVTVHWEIVQTIYLHARTYDGQMHTVIGMVAIKALRCTQFSIKECTWTPCA